MRGFFSVLILIFSAFSVWAQQGLQPKYNIPSTIAKVPEKSDFWGEWLRGDGGYRFEIDTVSDSSGEVVASYFNPDPINVESSVFNPEAEEPTLVIVLRDEGYPGSTYELMFYSEARALVGSYSRPGEQPAEVYFLKSMDVSDSAEH